MWPRWYKPPSRLTAEKLISYAATRFNVPRDGIVGNSRERIYMGPRTVVARILRERGHSYPVIGRIMGGRDHSTIIGCIAKFDVFARIDPLVPVVYEELRDRA